MEGAADIVLIADGESALWRLGRRSLTERLAIQFARLGAGSVSVLCTPELEPRLREEASKAGKPWATFTSDAGELGERLGPDRPVVVASASEVADDRLLEHAMGMEAPAAFADSEAGPHGIGGLAVVPIGLLAEAGAEVFDRAAGLPGVRIADIAGLPRFWLAQRRNLKPFSLPVGSRENLHRARWSVLNAAGKGHQEWPVILFNRPVETMISRILCESPITPNQITVLSLLCGFAAAALLAWGALGWGLLACIATAILDGLDGRQARVQIRFSRYGELEHVGDKLVEIGWIVALGWHLSQPGGSAAPLIGAIAWTGLLFLDNFSGSFFRGRTGFLPDLATPLDSAIRLIAPRRNTNIVYLAIGGLLGHLAAAFWIAIAATLLVTLLHWTRVYFLLRQPPRQPWIAGAAGSRHERLWNALFGVPPAGMGKQTP